MKVTKQELYLIGFFHLANLTKDPFEAFIMNDMFKDQFIDLTKHRRDTLAFFTNEDSSFEVFLPIIIFCSFQFPFGICT